MRLVFTMVVALAGCGAAPATFAEQQMQTARLQRVLVAVGACAGAVAGGGALDKADARGDVASVAGYVVLGACAAAGAVGIFGLPAFADPEPPPAYPIPQDRLDRDPLRPGGEDDRAGGMR